MLQKLMKKTDIKKCEKYGITAEVESIIENCECGVTEKARIVELSKLRRWELMEVIGNYLDAHKLDFNVKFKTFLKTYEITNDEVAGYYAEAVCEGGYEIAYKINNDIILILE